MKLHKRHLYQMAYIHTRDKDMALDIIQETTIVAFKNIKSLSYYSIIYFLISSFGSLMCGLGGIVEVQIAGHYSYPLWLAIIFIIIGVIEFGLVFVPPLWNIQFNQKTEENGKTIYIRPKKSILSLFQWIYLGIGYIQCILLLIASFLLKL